MPEPPLRFVDAESLPGRVNSPHLHHNLVHQITHHYENVACIKHPLNCSYLVPSLGQHGFGPVVVAVLYVTIMLCSFISWRCSFLYWALCCILDCNMACCCAKDYFDWINVIWINIVSNFSLIIICFLIDDNDVITTLFQRISIYWISIYI